MPKVVDYPKQLKPYRSHGIDLQWRDGDAEATADCPWCGREGKFSINAETGQCKCWVCGEGTEKGGGNPIIFLRQLWEASYAATQSEDYRELAEERGLLQVDTLVQWGVCRSTLTGDWLLPGYNLKGDLVQLYRYAQKYDREKWVKRLLATPGLDHQLFGTALFDPEKPDVYLCEGAWDAMALWEVLGQCRLDDKQVRETANPGRSILSSTNVLAVPGCNTFKEQWASLFSGRTVYLLYDSDHPITNAKTGKSQGSAGLAGVRRAAGILSEAKKPPEGIYYLRWGEEGYDGGLPSGYDVRDALRGRDDPQTALLEGLACRLRGLEGLLQKVAPVPKEWLRRHARASRARSSKTPVEGGGLEPTPCSSYQEVVAAWRKALKWTDGLDRALSCMLASALSTQMVGEQLWFKIISPASGGKTTIAEGLAVATRYVVSKDTVRGFHTGWRDEDGQDHSLAAEINGRTLVIKDGDTLLKSPNLLQILSEGRALYDRVSRTHYRNAVARQYLGHRTTILICGTQSLREIDDSELGVRFLDCVLMDGIDEDFEDAVGLMAVYQEARAMLQQSNGEPENQYPVQLAKAMALTGGYVEHLRENDARLLSGVSLGKRAARQCQRLGKFVAIMRARLPKLRSDDDREAGREFSARLNKQLVRLALSLAAVLGRDGVDDEVIQRVRQIALDTGRGNTLDVVSHLYEAGERGMALRSITFCLDGLGGDRTRNLMRFLKRMGAVELHEVEGKGTARHTHWRLTERMRGLYEDVLEIGG